jgi:hypothetical protein
VKDDFATIGLAADDAVEAPEGVRFLIRSRLFTDQEYEALEETSTG